MVKQKIEVLFVYISSIYFSVRPHCKLESSCKVSNLCCVHGRRWNPLETKRNTRKQKHFHSRTWKTVEGQTKGLHEGQSASYVSIYPKMTPANPANLIVPSIVSQEVTRYFNSEIYKCFPGPGPPFCLRLQDNTWQYRRHVTTGGDSIR